MLGWSGRNCTFPPSSRCRRDRRLSTCGRSSRGRNCRCTNTDPGCKRPRRRPGKSSCSYTGTRCCGRGDWASKSRRLHSLRRHGSCYLLRRCSRACPSSRIGRRRELCRRSLNRWCSRRTSNNTRTQDQPTPGSDQSRPRCSRCPACRSLWCPASSSPEYPKRRRPVPAGTPSSPSGDRPEHGSGPCLWHRSKRLSPRRAQPRASRQWNAWQHG
jgi:hypothetical protein